jgi:hypothetical protein
VKHHHSTIIHNQSIIKDHSVIHHIDIIKEIEEASREEAKEGEALEGV